MNYLGDNKVEVIRKYELKDVILKKLITEDYISKNEAKNIEIESSDIIGNELYLGIKNAINKKIHILKLNLSEMNNLDKRHISFTTFNIPVKNYSLTSLKIVDYNDIYIVLNKKNKSIIYQTDSTFNELIHTLKINEKVEGLEIINSIFFMATDDNKKDGKLIIKHAN